VFSFQCTQYIKIVIMNIFVFHWHNRCGMILKQRSQKL
jgi:hypothetical protein